MGNSKEKASSLIIKPWYKKKRYLIPIGIAILLSFNGDSNKTQETSQATQKVQSGSYTTNKTYTETSADQQQKATVIAPVPTSGLSNNNHYTNTVGNTVHSPAYSNSVPSGASALCRDGTYSFSQSRRGTCSHHGGVARWL